MNAQPLTANQLADLATRIDETVWERTGAPALTHLLGLDTDSCPLPVTDLAVDLCFAAARWEAARVWPDLVELPQAEQAAQIGTIEGRSLWGVVENLLSHAVALAADGNPQRALAIAQLAAANVERLPLEPPWINEPDRKYARAQVQLAEAHAHLCRHDPERAKERLDGLPRDERSPLGVLVRALFDLERSGSTKMAYGTVQDALRLTQDQPLLWIYSAVARLASQSHFEDLAHGDLAEALELLRTNPQPQALQFARGLRADLLSQSATNWNDEVRQALQELPGGEEQQPWFQARMEDDPALYQRAYKRHQAEGNLKDGQAALIAAELALCLLGKSGQAETLIALARSVAEDLADNIPPDLLHAFQLLDNPRLHTLAIGTRLVTRARSHYYRAFLYRLPTGPVRFTG
jgi:DNA-binding transcriptional regulator YdaS (Cro superfamily)